MIPWERLGSAEALDGITLELRRRGEEYLILAGGHDLMSSEDESSSRALAELCCTHLPTSRPPRLLVGGLGMGFTLRAALEEAGPEAAVEVVELIEAVVRWNQGELAQLAGEPLSDPRVELHVGDVRDRIAETTERYDAILLDVDNGPSALAHQTNESLYSNRGLRRAFRALAPGGTLGIWSFGEDERFTARLRRQGFDVGLHRVEGSRRGRGRRHRIWVARRPVTSP